MNFKGCDLERSKYIMPVSEILHLQLINILVCN